MHFFAYMPPEFIFWGVLLGFGVTVGQKGSKDHSWIVP